MRVQLLPFFEFLDAVTNAFLVFGCILWSYDEGPVVIWWTGGAAVAESALESIEDYVEAGLFVSQENVYGGTHTGKSLRKVCCDSRVMRVFAKGLNFVHSLEGLCGTRNQPSLTERESVVFVRPKSSGKKIAHMTLSRATGFLIFVLFYSLRLHYRLFFIPASRAKVC